jgi:hypothetical protein
MVNKTITTRYMRAALYDHVLNYKVNQPLI